jgi:asparagine synthetase B (glutamine-hydrolysing)
MEGRFPLATKMFMQYCMSMHTNLKLGPNKDNTKIFIKKAYLNKLPNEIISKTKTGWTVPIGHWLTSGSYVELTKFYKERTKENANLDVIKASQKAGKAIIPAWMVSDWIKKYKMNR